MVDGVVISGVDLLVSIAVRSDTGQPMVTGIEALRCRQGDLTAPVSISGGSWPISPDAGIAGGDAVEAFLPLSSLGVTGRMGLVLQGVSGEGGADTLTADGQPVVYGFPAPIPTLTQWTLILFLVLFLAAALVFMRRTRQLGKGSLVGLMALTTIMLVAAGVSIVVDGDVSDWQGLDPIGTDPSGDSVNGDKAVDLLGLFACNDGQNFFFRIDVADLENQPPSADSQAATVVEDTPATITLTGADPNGDPLGFIIDAPPNHGSLGPVTPTGNTSAEVVYIPAPNYHGPDQFRFHVNDGLLASGVASVDITVSPVNDCPVAVDDQAATDEDTVIAGNVLAANPATPDSDPEGDPLMVIAVNGDPNAVGVPVTLPSGALLTQNQDGAFVYDPNGQFDNLAAGASAQDAYTYTLDDGVGSGCAEIATVTVAIAGINDCPVAADDGFFLDKDLILADNVFADNGSGPDVDPEGDAFRVVSVNGSAANVGAPIVLPEGTLLTLHADGSFIYDPNGRFAGLAPGETAQDGFVYEIAESQGSCASEGSGAAAVITLTGNNDCPVAVNDVFNLNEDMILTGDVLAANPTTPDSDPEGDALTVTAVNGAPGSVGAPIALGSGLLTVNANGGFSFDPNGGYEALGSGDTAVETFTYTLDDGSGNCSETATVTVTVQGVNDCPTAVDDAVNADEDTVLTGDLFAANPTTPDSDPEGDALTVTAVNGAPGSVGAPIALGSGLLTVNANGGFSFDPNGGYEALGSGDTAVETFTYTLDDGSGNCSETATVTVTIQGANDCPTAVDDAVNADEDTVLTGDLFAANPTTPDSDPEGDALTVTAVNGAPGSVGAPIALGSGLLTVNANGGFSFDPNGGYEALGSGDTAVETFTYTLDDGSGNCSETATVTVTIQGANDCPTAVDDAVSADEDTVLTGDLFAANPTTPDSDPEGDALTVTAVNGAPGSVGVPIALGAGLLTVNANGGFSFDPNGGYEALGSGDTAVETFTYTLDDGSGNCSETATVTVTIQGANDCPTAVDDAVSADEDTVLTGDLFAANPTTPDSDPEGDTLTVTAVNGAPGSVGAPIALGSGLLTVNANGGFSFDPNGGYEALGSGDTAVETFTYTIDDGSGRCSETATANLTIVGVNDMPLVQGENFDGVSLPSVIGNTTLEFANASAIATPRLFVGGDVLDNDADPDSVLTLSAFDPISVQGGTVSMNLATGEFTYLPPAGFTGADSFTYTVTDGAFLTVATVNLTVVDTVWYIDNNVGVGDGRSSSPFNSVAAFNAEQGGGMTDDPESGDAIFLHASASVYSGGVALLDNQRLIGQGRNLSVNGHLLAAATTSPSLTNPSGDVVTLANDNLVEGLRLLPVASAGIVAAPGGRRPETTGKRFGGATIIRFVTINPAGSSDGLTFSLRTGTLTVHDTVIQGLPGATGRGVVGDASNVILDLDDVAIQSPLGAGMAFNDMTGALQATNVSVSTDGPGLDIRLGAMAYVFNGASSIAQTTGGPGVTVTGVGGGSLVFDTGASLTVSNLGAGLDAISLDAAGADFNLTLRDLTIDASGGDDAIALSNLGAGSLVAFAGSFSVNGAGDRGVALNGVEASMSFPISAAISGTVGAAFEIVGGAGDVAYPGALTNASGPVIQIDGRTGGMVAFSNTVTDQAGGLGVRVANSAGSQVFADLDLGALASRLGVDAIQLSNNTGTITLEDISVFTNGGRGLAVSGGSPSLNINPGGLNDAVVDTLGALGVDIADSAVNANFGQVTVVNGSGGGLRLDNNTGVVTFGLVTIANTGGTGFAATNTGAVNVTDGASTVATVNGTALFINPTTVSMTFADVTSTNSPSTGVSFTDMSGSLTILGGMISGSAATAFEVNGGDATAGFGGTIANATGHSVSVSGRSGGVITLSGTINDTGAGILLQGNSAGSTLFNGAGNTINTGANPALSLLSNNGHAVQFNGGGLTIGANGATGIDANDGGVLEITGADNTIQATNGLAVHLRGGSTIGGNGASGGMVFSSISASGGNNGIVLNGTGVGRFVVTGVGNTDASGGTLQNINQNGIELIDANNIAIHNMDLIDANLTDNCGTEAYDEFSGGLPGNQSCRGAIYMLNVEHVAFTNILIDDTAEQGINGVGVTHFQLIDSEVRNAGDGNSESGILLRDLLGTVGDGTVNVIDNSIVRDSAQIGLFVRNNLRTNGFSGEPDRLELRNGSQFLLSAATDNGDNVTISLRDDNPSGNGAGANFETVVNNCVFTGRVGASSTTDQIQVDAGVNAKSQVTITGSTFSNSNTGINLSGANGSQTSFTVNNNPAISVRFGAGVNLAVNGSAAMDGSVANNPNIDSAMPNNPAFGIDLIVDSNGSAVVDINNNTITDFLLPLRAGARGGSGTADITIRNNDMTSSAVTGFGVVDLICGNGTPGESNAVCFNIFNNDAFDPQLQGEYFITMTPGTTCTIQGYMGQGNDRAAIEAFLDANQSSGSSTVCEAGTCGLGIVNYSVGGVCLTP